MFKKCNTLWINIKSFQSGRSGTNEKVDTITKVVSPRKRLSTTTENNDDHPPPKKGRGRPKKTGT